MKNSSTPLPSIRNDNLTASSHANCVMLKNLSISFYVCWIYFRLLSSNLINQLSHICKSIALSRSWYVCLSGYLASSLIKTSQGQGKARERGWFFHPKSEKRVNFKSCQTSMVTLGPLELTRRAAMQPIFDLALSTMQLVRNISV